MTRKKREIQKRKRQQESRSEPALETNVDSFSGQPEEGESERIDLQKGSRVLTSTGPVSPQGKSGTATRPFQAGGKGGFFQGQGKSPAWPPGSVRLSVGSRYFR